MNKLDADAAQGAVILLALVTDGFRLVPVHDDLAGRLSLLATPIASGLPSIMPSIMAFSDFSGDHFFIVPWVFFCISQLVTVRVNV